MCIRDSFISIRYFWLHHLRLPGIKLLTGAFLFFLLSFREGVLTLFSGSHGKFHFFFLQSGLLSIPVDTAVLDVYKRQMQLCDHYEKLFSRTLPESEIYRLNHGEISEVSSETADLIRTGLSYGELSDGAFDISIEPVSSLWDFTSGSGRIPGQKELDAAIALVDYRKVHVDGQTVTFDTPGMGLDLGAIAKGYIADRIKDYLKKEMCIRDSRSPRPAGRSCRS